MISAHPNAHLASLPMDDEDNNNTNKENKTKQIHTTKLHNKR